MERVRCPRAALRAAPGRFRASASQHYGLGREVLAGRGQVKAGNARTNCVGAAPGMGTTTGSALIPSPRKHGLRPHLGMEYSLGQNRGGTPTGERARSGGSARAGTLVARPAPAGAEHETLRLSAFRFLLFLSFFLPSVIASEAKQSSAAVRRVHRRRSSVAPPWIASSLCSSQ